MTVETLPWLLAAALLLIALAVIAVVVTRGQRQLRARHAEVIATKDEQIALLDSQVVSLRESESLRFVERYIGSKQGLEERQTRFYEQLEAVREEKDRVLSELGDFALTADEREAEARRLRNDLIQTTDQVRRLESVLKEVASVAPVDVEAIQKVLGERLELSAHITDRLDRLSLEQQERAGGKRHCQAKLEQLDAEEQRLRRELEITRAAGTMVDAFMGIDGEVKKILGRHASDHVEAAIHSLDAVSQRNPIASFVDALREPRRGLLEKGRSDGPAPADDTGEPGPRPQRPRNTEAGEDQSLNETSSDQRVASRL